MTKTPHYILWRKVQILSATFFCGALMLVACKKKDTMLGANALDPNAMLNSASADTFSLKTYTTEDDSILSKNARFALLGSYVDPKFGTMNASFYTQLVLESFDPDFGSEDPITIDSLILGLPYGGYYGDTSQQTFEVYRLAEDLSNDSTYYTFDQLATTGGDLVAPGQGTITPKPTTKATVGTEKLSAQLRIPLKTSLAQELIDEAEAGNGSFSTRAAFLEYFKGFYVKVNNPGQASGSGGVFYINLTSTQSKMTIYYTQNGSQKTYDFRITSDCVDFNHIEVDNAGAPSGMVANNPALGQTEFYAQANNSRAAIEIPGIENYPPHTAIQRAELILPITHYTNSLLYPSVQLFYGRIEAGGDHTSIPVYPVQIVYDYNLKQYSINIRDYVQGVVNGDFPNDGIYLISSAYNATVERIVFNGSQTNNKKKPKLVVTYTSY